MQRKRIPDRTKLAALTVLHYGIPYDHAKLMTEVQVNSLVVWDHNILHETGHPDRDKFWNLTPMSIAAHRNKTKQDAKIIAKGRRLRKKLSLKERQAALLRFGKLAEENPKLMQFYADTFSAGWDARSTYQENFVPHSKRKIRSRGFDKTRRRKMRGKVEPR